MDQEKTYKWIQDRLRDLHSGTLSEADRARLFEMAHQDPFLKDALEGYQSSSQHDHAIHLRNISHRIQKKGLAKRRYLLPDRRGWVMQAVAASLVLILVTWAVIYYLEDEENTILVATETEIERPDESSRRLMEETKEIEADIASEESAGNEINEAPTGLRAHATEKAEEAKSGSSGTLHVLDGVPVEKRDEILSEPAASKPPATTYKPAQEVESDVVTNESPAAATDQDAKSRDEGYYANQMSPAMMNKRITGQVIDAYGQAIPGAFIVLQNSNLATTSNLYG